MLARATPRRAADAHHVAWANRRTFADEYLREVAIADDVVAVPQGYIFAGCLVLSDLHDLGTLVAYRSDDC